MIFFYQNKNQSLLKKTVCLKWIFIFLSCIATTWQWGSELRNAQFFHNCSTASPSGGLRPQEVPAQPQKNFVVNGVSIVRPGNIPNFGIRFPLFGLVLAQS